MTIAAPVAVTGAHGRLGRALVAALRARGVPVLQWTRPDFDLDDHGSTARLALRDRPRLVIHAAAWTDVDACARQPQLAMRRNGTAVGELAAACADVGADLVFVSTNEVFDGRRTDGRGYTEDDPVSPLNPYGVSKLSGERMAREAYRRVGSEHSLWIVRTAWLFGPPGNDFPSKILARAEQLPPGESLPVVADEIGSPTYTVDLAPAILHLVSKAPAGLYHLAAAGAASRFEFAQHVLAECRRSVTLKPIGVRDFERASTAPAWAVLDSSCAARSGARLRPWRDGLSGYLGQLCAAQPSGHEQ